MNWHNQQEKDKARKRAIKLKRQYEKSKMTLAEFAQTLGCSRQALSKRLAKAI